MDACWLPGGKVEVFVFTKGIKTKKPSNSICSKVFLCLFWGSGAVISYNFSPKAKSPASPMPGTIYE
jgi:hypothetical protein